VLQLHRADASSHACIAVTHGTDKAANRPDTRVTGAQRRHLPAKVEIKDLDQYTGAQDFSGIHGVIVALP
jgi:hypothetical protein